MHTLDAAAGMCTIALGSSRQARITSASHGLLVNHLAVRRSLVQQAVMLAGWSPNQIDLAKDRAHTAVNFVGCLLPEQSRCLMEQLTRAASRGRTRTQTRRTPATLLNWAMNRIHQRSILLHFVCDNTERPPQHWRDQ